MNKLSCNRNQIKYLVIAAMLIDHIAWAFVPTESVLGQIMHFIGRLTGPTMSYFLVEGYLHTRDVKKYVLRLGVFALISWPPFCLFEFQSLPLVIGEGGVQLIPAFGVIYTLFLSLLAVWLWDQEKYPVWCRKLGVAGLCVLSIFGDWPVFGVLYAVVLFCYRDDEKRKWRWFCIITAFTFIFGGIGIWGIYQLGIFMVPILIRFCYNGEAGSRHPVHKWFFYLFYPLHLLALGLLQM